MSLGIFAIMFATVFACVCYLMSTEPMTTPEQDLYLRHLAHDIMHKPEFIR